MKIFNSRLIEWNRQLFVALFNCLKYGLLTLLIMLVINYAALSKEKEILKTHGLEYDIGLGQKIFMSCKGHGLPTVIMESNIGSNSDVFLALQYQLIKITKVVKMMSRIQCLFTWINKKSRYLMYFNFVNQKIWFFEIFF